MTTSAARLVVAVTVLLISTILGRTSGFAEQVEYDLCPLIPVSGGALTTQRPGSLASRANAQPLQVIRDLEEYTGLPPNSFSLWPTRDGRVRNNAAAQACQGQRFIFYDEPYFMSMRGGRSGANWTKYFTFAHEIGHHQLNHFDGPPKPRKQKELEADEHAGYLLARMKIPGRDLIRAVDTLEPSRQPREEYPGQCERREASLKGYNRAALQMDMPRWEFAAPCSVLPPIPRSINTTTDLKYVIELAYAGSLGDLDKEPGREISDSRFTVTGAERCVVVPVLAGRPYRELDCLFPPTGFSMRSVFAMAKAAVPNLLSKHQEPEDQKPNSNPYYVYEIAEGSGDRMSLRLNVMGGRIELRVSDRIGAARQ